MAGVAVALRFVPYSDDHGNFRRRLDDVHDGGAVLVGLAASVYVVYTLEILKFKRFRMRAASRAPRSSRSSAEIEHELETGEFPEVGLDR